MKYLDIRFYPSYYYEQLGKQRNCIWNRTFAYIVITRGQ